MSLVAQGLAAAGGLAGAGACAGLVAPVRWRAALVGVVTSAAGGAGAVAGAAAISGQRFALQVPWLLPLGGVRLAVDPLAGWFLLLIGAVGALAGGYVVGYVGRSTHGAGSRTGLAVLPVFVAAMLAVPAAGSVSTFLLAWELMAVTSLLLVLAEHRHSPAVRSAGLWYAAMTQAGFVVILLGLVWLAAYAADDSFAALRAAAGGLPGPVRAGVFVLTAAGFASKAGVVPGHVWLPRAHAEAPSHASALMSAAMVKLGVYGIVRVGFDLLGGGPAWWWLLLAASGAASALYGILQAAVASDLKRLLAYSTSENIGLILIGVGAGGLFAASGQQGLAGLALAAALLHCLNHAGFKTLLFFGAGSVLRATGTRDLDALGGLATRMPATTALFAAGALAAAALPPGNGFVSEWLLLQSLLGSLPPANTVTAVVAPIMVGVIALTAGVGVATYVKAVGTGFLARPRSDAAAGAVESPPTMLAGMGLAAAGCAGLALVPTAVAPGLQRVVDTLGGGSVLDGSGLRLRIGGIASTMSPLYLAAGLVAITVTLAVLARAVGRPRRVAPPWGCGAGPLTPRMEYTATSFAEPLQRVFDDVLAPEQDVEVTHYVESAYLVRRVEYRRRVGDRIEARVYAPLLAAVRSVGRAATVLANGSVHRYLAYTLAALLVVLSLGVLR
ncbi:Hydrogenase-4 component B / Formate hydrogenlyase subunit 3 [Carbonactinospora thermoautotrophica]|uniref:Hydrogenase-4 component B / Formate hydrogenlyase subunit 3 n=4 Tax=Carbonactinospora thermoautotrophica TaxID=1469144 RepID=A0A132MLA5_9ACTN|nr:Hydrogenase-4 component B / Formate hydrogenlyase subunit 3 [Carbonactinospora thermoautotrophica]